MAMHKSKLITAGLLALMAGCDQDVGPGRWDNSLDPDGSNFHPPSISLNDTVIRNSIDGQITAHATSRNSSIASVRWVRNDTLLADTDTILSTKGWTDGWYWLSAQAMDANGLASSVAKIGLWVGNRLPVFPGAYDHFAYPDTPDFISLSAFDPDGTIISVAWDTVPDRYSFGTQDFSVSGPPGSRKYIYAKAVDNDGGAAEVMFSVYFTSPPAVRMAIDVQDGSVVSSYGSSGTSSVRLNSNSLPILIGAGSPDFTDQSLLQVTLGDGDYIYGCNPTTDDFLSGTPVANEHRFLCYVDPSTWTSSSRTLIAQAVTFYGDTASASLNVTILR
jgi:hypothetical protein